MGISKYNSEGYYDPTAYEAIRRVEESLKVLMVTYPSGYMRIHLDRFFPCTIDKARKVFTVIHRYATEIDKDRLQTFFLDQEKWYQAQMNRYADKASAYSESCKEHRDYLSKFKNAKQLHQRIRRNREIFETGRDS